jgi:hypothetical protein
VGDYPDWRYFPAFEPPPSWVGPLVGVFKAHQDEIDSQVVHEQPMKSDVVLDVLADDLESVMGFKVERGKTKSGKLHRPVFFGDRGTFLRASRSTPFTKTLESPSRSRRVERRWATRSIETWSKRR